MNCPVCNRILTPTLSICPSCGAMMNDTVREELQTKIKVGVEKKINPDEPPVTSPQQGVGGAPPPIKHVETARLNPAKTSPTLVEFQTKDNVVPAWRLQIQNAVHQRLGSMAASRAKGELELNQSAVLGAQPVKRTPALESLEISDERVARALKRINDSRKRYLPAAKAWKKSTSWVQPPMKPYGVLTNQENKAPAGLSATLNSTTKPNVLPMPVAPQRRLINEPPKSNFVTPESSELKHESPGPKVVSADNEQTQPSTKNVELSATPKTLEQEGEFVDVKSIRIKARSIEIEAAHREEFDDEIEDLAPFSMRFGAGLFDLIIGGFVTLLLLSPHIFTSEEWWTKGGLLLFAVVWAVVLFLYMTATLGFFGKTLGMKLFSLELIDAVENEYPTLYQAAISSGLFILLLPLGGAGFITAIFNPENRAVHDLVSGTILVREF